MFNTRFFNLLCHSTTQIRERNNKILNTKYIIYPSRKLSPYPESNIGGSVTTVRTLMPVGFRRGVGEAKIVHNV